MQQKYTISTEIVDFYKNIFSCEGCLPVQPSFAGSYRQASIDVRNRVPILFLSEIQVLEVIDPRSIDGFILIS
jgi:hypothetical protein